MSVSGTVKAWIEERGMGFIQPADGTADVFVHRSALTDGNSLRVGAPVTFEPGWDAAKGKPIANKCTGGVAEQATVPVASLANGQPGIVKAWIEARGMGFITPEDGSPDVFVHRSNLVDGNCLSVGAKVMFEGGWDEQKGKPIAKTVSGAGDSNAHPMMPHGKPGRVKAWIEARGMGFITPADGSADVFVHRSNLLDGDTLIVGAQVVFEAGFDAQKGKPIAKACAGASQGAPSPMVPMAPMGHMGYGGGGVQTVGGTVKVWFADKGYGFITLDSGMGDAFVGSSAIPPGMTVSDGLRINCAVQWNDQKQKFTAVEVYDLGKGKGKGGAGGDASDNCFVTGLPLDIEETKLQEIFAPYGAVVSCKVLPGEGRPDRAAMVRFGSVEEAKWVVETVSGETLGLPAPITVKFAKPSTPSPGPGKGFDYGGYGGYGGGKGPKGPPNSFAPAIRPGKGAQVQAARVGTVRAVMANSLLVSPSEGGMDVSVPRHLLLDGNAQVGGLVSFSVQDMGAGGYGKAAIGGKSHRSSPYGQGSFQKGGMPAMQQNGVVKAWMESRGMGFIQPSDGGADLFVHRSYLQDGGALVVGSPVTFTPEFDPQKGKPIAKNVQGAVPQP